MGSAFRATWQLVDGVRELIMEQRPSIAAAHIGEHHARHPTGLDLGCTNAHACAVVTALHLRNLHPVRVALGGTILPEPVVAIQLDGHLRRLQGLCERSIESQREAIVLRGNLDDLKRCFRRATHTRQAVARRQTTPTAVGQPQEQRALISKKRAHCRAHIRAHHEDGALPDVLYLFEIRAQHHAVGQFRQDHLLAPRCEPLGGHDHVAGGTRPLVWHPQSGAHPRHIYGRRDARYCARGSEILTPFQTRWRSVKAALLDDNQRADRNPVALVVRDQQGALGPEANARRTAEARRPRLHDTIRADAGHPTAVRSQRASMPPLGVGEAQIQRDPEVAIAVDRQTERELMVILGYTPIVAQRAHLVATTVSVGVK